MNRRIRQAEAQKNTVEVFQNPESCSPDGVPISICPNGIRMRFLCRSGFNYLRIASKWLRSFGSRSDTFLDNPYHNLDLHSEPYEERERASKIAQNL